jgi:hypothetical protein
MADEGSQTGSPEIKTDKSLPAGDAPCGTSSPRNAETKAPAGSEGEPGTIDKPDKKL